MYDETNVPGPEYRVRPVVRYVVTRYCHPYRAKDGSHGMDGSSQVIGEFAQEIHAHDVAVALAKHEEHFGSMAKSEPVGAFTDGL